MVTINQVKLPTKGLSLLEQLSIHPELFSKDSSLQTVPDALQHHIDRLKILREDPEDFREALFLEVIQLTQKMKISYGEGNASKSEKKKLRSQIQYFEKLLLHLGDKQKFISFLSNFSTLEKSYKIKYDLSSEENLRKEYHPLYELHEALLTRPDRYKFIGRLKGLDSFENKAIRNIVDGNVVNSFKDIMGFRVTLFDDNIPACYDIMRFIMDFLYSHDCLPGGFTPLKNTKVQKITESPIPGIKDYILNPKSTEYQSLHASFVTSSGNPFEFQVRTLKMDFTAERGSASHSLVYKIADYSNLIPFIHMDGFTTDSDGHSYLDYAGILDPMEFTIGRKVV